MSFVLTYRSIYLNNKFRLRNWFWNTFNWNRESIWIGKLPSNNLPNTDNEIIEFVKSLQNDFTNKLSNDNLAPSGIYLKIYFARNVRNGSPELNYLIISDTLKLPTEFSRTMIGIISEKYQVVKDFVDTDEEFKELLDHYLIWCNYYKYYNLICEIDS